MLTIAFVVPAALAAHVPRNETRDYLGNGYTFYGVRLVDCAGTTPLPSWPGEVCFALDGSETFVDVSVTDDSFTNVGGVITWRPGAGSTVFCDAIAGVPVPPGQSQMRVTLGESFACPPGSGSARGQVTAYFP